MMHMETGPMGNQSMNNWLAWTGSLELLAVGFFTGFILVLHSSIRETVSLFSLLGLVALDVMLVQGGVYWWVKRWPIRQHVPALQRLRLLQGMYAISGLLLLLFPAGIVSVWLLHTPLFHESDMFIGLGLYLLGCGEFMHYFVYKINMRPAEYRRMWRKKHLILGRFARELRRAMLEVSRLPK